MRAPYWDISGVRFEKAGPPRRLLNVTRLAREDSPVWQLVWRCFKRRRPEVAALLQDPNLHALRAAFDGEIHIELD